MNLRDLQISVLMRFSNLVAPLLSCRSPFQKWFNSMRLLGHVLLTRWVAVGKYFRHEGELDSTGLQDMSPIKCGKGF